MTSSDPIAREHVLHVLCVLIDQYENTGHIEHTALRGAKDVVRESRGQPIKDPGAFNYVISMPVARLSA